MARATLFSQSARGRGRGYTLIGVLPTGPIRRYLPALVVLVGLWAPAAAQGSLQSVLKHQIRAAGHYSGALVVDVDSGKTLFSWRPGTPRILASNTKLFTTATALARFGVDGQFQTQVLSNAAMSPDGILKGDLWLRGGGDPAFGTLGYVRKHYGAEAGSVEYLVDQLSESGMTAVRGGIHGDESAFDTIRGVHDSGYGTSPWVGPL